MYWIHTYRHTYMHAAAEAKQKRPVLGGLRPEERLVLEAMVMRIRNQPFEGFYLFF